MHVVVKMISVAQFDLHHQQNISSPQTLCDSPLSLCIYQTKGCADECPADHVPWIYTPVLGNVTDIRSHVMPTWTCFPLGTALLGHSNQTWSWISWKLFLYSMEAKGVTLAADSTVTLPLAVVSPSQDNTEGGDDSGSTSDICYIGYEGEWNAGVQECR
jgi:hypothetical protein